MTSMMDSLFAGLFGASQTRKAHEAYRRAIENAAREVAAWDEAEASLALCIPRRAAHPSHAPYYYC